VVAKVSSVLFALYFASLILLMAPYFLSRSSMWGQLQSFLFPFAMCSSACVAYWLNAESLDEDQASLSTASLPFLSVALSLALSLSSLALHPDPLSQLQRIFPPSVFDSAQNGLPLFAWHRAALFEFTKLYPRNFPPAAINPDQAAIVLADYPNIRQAENMDVAYKFWLPANSFEYMDLPKVKAVICERVQPLLRDPSVTVVPSGKRASLESLCSASG
jgi:hypothetical protein